MSYLKVSENGRYFTRGGQPFFWMGDTIWPAVSIYTPDEAEYYFKRRSQQGFTVAHIMLPWEMWDGQGERRDAVAGAGDTPLWLNNNPATPNEAYFVKLDAVIATAKKHGILLVILACGGGWGTFVDYMKTINAGNARAYGRWLGARYRDEPGIVWSNGFDLPPWMYEDVTREFTEGMLEGDGGAHLLFYHPCGGTSSNHFHNEAWLCANFIQTWADYNSVQGMVAADYHRRPHKPVIHVEGAYEAGTEYPTAPITALIVRRQAYASYLSGGFHTYGHNDLWRKTAYWRDAMDAPGANQMTLLKGILTSLNWWELIPDQTLFAGAPQNGYTAARTADGRRAVLYFSRRITMTVNAGIIGGGAPVRAQWIDPQDGHRFEAVEIKDAGACAFIPPARCEDGVLIIEKTS